VTTAIKATPAAPAVARSTAIRRGRHRARGPQRPSAPRPVEAPKAPLPPVHDQRRLEDVTWPRRLRWVLLAAVPSSLMLGITTYMSTDVAAIPFFWVLPLSLYLLSFILVFLRWPVPWTGRPHTVMVMAQLLFIMGFIIHLLQTGSHYEIEKSILLSVLGFFFTAMMCHGELARDRPGTKHLTEFYLWLSVGGMIGGMFNGLVAPLLFNSTLELQIAIALSWFVRPYKRYLVPLDGPVAVLLGLILGAAVAFILQPGLIIGLIIVALGGLYDVLSPARAGKTGWTEGWLIGLFPGLGQWADAKGRELRQGKTAESPAEPRPRSASGAPDYYVLSYTLDIILPILVAILVWWIHAYFTTWRGWVLGLANFLSLEQLATLRFRDAMTMLVVYAVPVIICFLYFPRPLRLGLGIAAVLLFTNFAQERGERVLYSGRSYFGVLRVYRSIDEGESAYPLVLLEAEAVVPPRKKSASDDGKKKTDTESDYEDWVGKYPPFHYLLHGTTHHGLNYQAPQGLRRLATTYYHRHGPVGVIMEKRYNWFKDKVNRYHSDVRMPASMWGLGADPMSQLVNLWSEPPFATIGLGTGTMASYAHPWQHMTYYEIDDTIRSFHEKGWATNDGQPFFNYVKDARERDAFIEIIMGDARLSMQNEPEQNTGWLPNRDGYYHALVVDAFSSDAIPVHLITKEAIQLYFQKLAPDGVLMVHTSNRHLELVWPVTDIVADLRKNGGEDFKNLAYRVGKDSGLRFIKTAKGREQVYGRDPETRRHFFNEFYGPEFRGLFGSEYVMIARHEKYLPAETSEREPGLNWGTPAPPGNRVWTDDFSNLVGVLRFLHRRN
jgi:hypothetical protein